MCGEKPGYSDKFNLGSEDGSADSFCSMDSAVASRIFDRSDRDAAILSPGIESHTNQICHNAGVDLL